MPTLTQLGAVAYADGPAGSNGQGTPAAGQSTVALTQNQWQNSLNWASRTWGQGNPNPGTPQGNPNPGTPQGNPNPGTPQGNPNPGTPQGNPNGGNNGNANDRVTICHATGSATNPYVVITPNKNGVVSGHIGHQDGNDIIPPFTYNDHGVTRSFVGQNYAGNEAFFAAGCQGTPPVPVLVTVCRPTTVGSTTTYAIVSNTTFKSGDLSANASECAAPVLVTVCRPTTVGSTTTYAIVSNTTFKSGDLPANASQCTSPVLVSGGGNGGNGGTTNGGGNGGTTNGGGNGGTTNGGGITNGGGTIGGGTGGGATAPTQISHGTAPQAVTLPAVSHVTVPAAGTTAAPAALPFTGSNTGLLLELAALLLLVGGGLTFAARTPRPAHAVV